MEKLVAVMLGDGFEPLEALAPIDVLRRGGMKVDTVSVMEGRQVTSAQGVTLYADAGVGDVDLMGFDMIVVPGGSGGVENLARCEPLAAALRAFMAEGRLVAAICAGPTILADLGLLEGRTATCYPGCEEGFPAGAYQAEMATSSPPAARGRPWTSASRLCGPWRATPRPTLWPRRCSSRRSSCPRAGGRPLS